MISSLLHFIVRIFWFAVKTIGLISQITSVTSLRVILVLCILVYSLSRYFRLKQPQLPHNLADAIAGTRIPFSAVDRNQQCATATTAPPTKAVATTNSGPIANRAGCLDSIENSRSAIKNCVAQSCSNILLDVNLTKCGQLVILHEQTLHRIENSLANGMTTSTDEKMPATMCINAMAMDELSSINLAKNHPLCKETPHEAVMHLNDLMQLLDAHDHLNVFLLAGSTNKAIVSILSRYYENNPERFKRIVICSRSPIIIYQLRKRNPQLICALWLDRIADLKLPTILLNSSAFFFVYGLIFRNIVAILTGIHAVFISKHDFNAHLSEMWIQANVRPIVYTLNSPSEKRYFQQTRQTQYLTDSLRSEPHHFAKLRAK